ncbi:hypothetical protein BH18ACI4_BH18ACI4_21950 [soil metagenome]
MLITAAGTISSKSQLIENIKSPDLTIEPFDTEEVKVRVLWEHCGDRSLYAEGKLQGENFQ